MVVSLQEAYFIKGEEAQSKDEASRVSMFLCNLCSFYGVIFVLTFAFFTNINFMANIDVL